MTNVDGAIMNISYYRDVSISFIHYTRRHADTQTRRPVLNINIHLYDDIHEQIIIIIIMASQVGTNHVRNQRKNQNARQATMISGLSTIYRTQTLAHAIQKHQQTEPRIFLLDITLEDMNQMYSKIHGIIERGRLRPKGTELFFVYKKNEHFIVSEDTIYEIKNGNKRTVSPDLIQYIPIDGPVITTELCVSRYSDDDSHGGETMKENVFTIPLLVDESYYKLSNTSLNIHTDTHANSNTYTGTHISPNHVITRHVKITVKLHPKSANSFVFIMNETETRVLDFYFTTENGIIESTKQSNDVITKTCKDDILSFIDQFKLCS